MKKLHAIFFIVLIFIGCDTNPLTGKKTMAFLRNESLFPQSFAEYNEFINDPKVKVIKDDDKKRGSDVKMVKDMGGELAKAAQSWFASEGYPNYLKGYQWEYNLVDDNQVNAWCMPGGKIVVYTGIIDYMNKIDSSKTEVWLALVLGHEISHALLNHGQQRMSAGLLQQLGALVLGLAVSGKSETTQGLLMAAYSVGTTVAGMLPFSRENESEADHYGLILMAIAGYDTPSKNSLEYAVSFWDYMAASGGSSLEFLSTHPNSAKRAENLRGWIPEARATAERLKKP